MSAQTGEKRLTQEDVSFAIQSLTSLLAAFERSLNRNSIDGDELEALTKRFKSTLAGTFGIGSAQYKQYEDWLSYDYHVGGSDWDDGEDYDDAYGPSVDFRGGAKRTMTAIRALIEELEQIKIHTTASKSIPEGVELAIQLCQRLPSSAKVLSRRRKGKEPFEINDEYDVQELLHCILRAYFKYSIREEPLGKVSGLSSRADLAIEELRTLIEVKFVHGPDDQERIIKEFAQDLLAYSQWPSLSHFVYVVYNSDDLKDPEVLDKLAGPQQVQGRDFFSHIVRI